MKKETSWEIKARRLNRICWWCGKGISFFEPRGNYHQECHKLKLADDKKKKREQERKTSF